ncbi:hypothetical protein [Streptomyces sp. UNOB3_S3]|uniref:phage terminase small subunit n=1 Tax=Streptomyces sp. UNOB3_S3 TaxID=2871682 RepID=UPI001E46C2B8|nr:hypothetical protein [Streptomyces sp. UNOB3_S3]
MASHSNSDCPIELYRSAPSPAQIFEPSHVDLVPTRTRGCSDAVSSRPGPEPERQTPEHQSRLGEHELTPAAGEGRTLQKSLGIQTGGAKRFWSTWSSAPQTQHWLETDWAELEITTRLVDEFHQGNVRLAGEIRQRVGRWGARTDMDAELFRMLSES